MLTNADLQSFAPSDTIRVPSSLLIQKNNLQQLQHFPNRPRRERSPVKGLFGVVKCGADVSEGEEEENGLRGRARHSPNLNDSTSPHFICHSTPRLGSSIPVQPPDAGSDENWAEYEDGLKTPVPSQPLTF